MNILLLEFMGYILICSTIIITMGNPILVGMAHMAALQISNGRVEGDFNLMFLVYQYILGRLTTLKLFQHLAIQFCAVSTLIVAFSI